jgi:hypothetical protein
MGQHPPLDAPVDDIKEGIDHRSHLQLGPNPTLTLVANSKMGAMNLFTPALEEQRNRVNASTETTTSVGESSWSEFATSVNTPVTSRQVTPYSCDGHQCQIGLPFLCGRNRHKINACPIHHTVAKRLKPI